MAYYNTCPKCGANLDPGEKCTCWQEKEPKMVPDRTIYIKLKGKTKKTINIEAEMYKFNF